MAHFIADDADDHVGWILAALAAGVVAMALALFGLPPVSVHGPFHYLGIMDPLCGMTRATRLLARGDVLSAWRYNPGSFLLGALAILVITRAVVGRLSGQWWRVDFDRRRMALTSAFMFAALEINQQLHASLLR